MKWGLKALNKALDFLLIQEQSWNWSKIPGNYDKTMAADDMTPLVTILSLTVTLT